MFSSQKSKFLFQALTYSLFRHTVNDGEAHRALARLACRTQSIMTARDQSDLRTVSLAYAMYDPDPVVDKESPIFVLHGLFGSKMNWNTMSKNLASITKRRVIALDHRNHGDSPHTDDFSYNHLAADVGALMSELGVDKGKASLIGHSLGGRTIMTLALQYPSIVRDLVVVDISPIGIIPQPEYYEALVRTLQEISLPESLPLSKGRAIANMRLSGYIKSKGLRNFILTNLVKTRDDKFTWRINLDSLVKNMPNIAEMPYSDNSTFPKPTLFICGEKSPYVKREDHRGIYKLFPKAEIVYFENAGHLVHAQQPKQFLDQVTNFLKKNYN
ncbi:protein ABHD11-like [Cimex lectularius]|uniref:sn-1-specific diacylglycerol lipase ABHD11 n=1 Tax=Cimex lectularius TaxID=79782 RepID=A0A8I6RNH8_CIMLE|nr:protein ABHD11-like [Cimex lectularius]